MKSKNSWKSGKGKLDRTRGLAIATVGDGVYIGQDGGKNMRLSMSGDEWIRLAQRESHWGVFFVLNPPSKLPTTDYWLRQESLGKRIKYRLKKLLQNPEFAQLLKRAKVRGREVAAIVGFNQIKRGYFERTYRKFKRNPPPFSYEKNLRQLKKHHLGSDLMELIRRRNPRMKPITWRSITNHLVQHL